MYLRCHSRRKNGKRHRYWSVVESRRVSGTGRRRVDGRTTGRVVQRPVLYLGEINDSQEAAWRKTISVFDEQKQRYEQHSLFPSDRPIPADEANALSVVLSELRLVRPRSYGDCWLGCLLWEELELSAFWDARLAQAPGAVPWRKVLQVLTINRLCEPGSEFAVHRRWFDRSAMDELLGVDFAAAAKDRLYRCLDRLLVHKDELCKHLTQRWTTLFDASFDVLLYDLTSTYFEGLCEQIPKARHGYSRDGRPDCRQVVIALVVTTDGLPLAYEVLAGNTIDCTTLRGFLNKIESMYGKARRVWVMDRGIPTKETLQQMREEGVAYLVGTPKRSLSKLEKGLIDKPWERVHEGVQVKLLEQENELYVLAKSADRQKKEQAIRRRKLKTLVHGLNRLKRRPISRDNLLKKIAVLQKEAGAAARFVKIREPQVDEPVTRQTFVCALDKAAWKAALERDGCYLLRAYLPEKDFPPSMERQPSALWGWYMQLIQVEEAFKTLKGDLALRPIHHQVEQRVEAHIFVAFLGYCLTVTLRMKLRGAAPGLTPREVLACLSAIQLVDVCIPTTDGRTLILPRYTEPQAEQQMILEKLNLSLPAQPPPRIRGGDVMLPKEGPT
jgi:Transposase DDE domain